MHPPLRETERGSLGMTVYEASVKNAVTVADDVAVVRIGNWLYETEGGGTTVYEAEVLRQWKGTLPEHILIRQCGSSSATFKDYPLHDYGDVLTIFLGADDDPESGEPNGYYMSIAMQYSEFCTEQCGGDYCFFDRLHSFEYDLWREAEKLQVPMRGEALGPEFAEAYAETDPWMAEQYPSGGCRIYTVDNLFAVLDAAQEVYAEP